MEFCKRSLTDVVDRIIVITIASAKERQADISSLMGRLGLPFEFHFGRDSRGIPVSDLTKMGDYDPIARLESGRPRLQQIHSRQLRVSRTSFSIGS